MCLALVAWAAMSSTRMVRNLESCVEVRAAAPGSSFPMVWVLVARATESSTRLVHNLTVGVDVQGMVAETGVAWLDVVSCPLGGGVGSLVGA